MIQKSKKHRETEIDVPFFVSRFLLHTTPTHTHSPHFSNNIQWKYNFWLVVSSENAQLTMEEPELGFQIG
jgi:hypothetical protein